MEPLSPAPRPAGEAPTGRSARSFAGAVLRRWPTILLITLVTVLAGAVATHFQTPVYEGETMIRIDKETSTFGMPGVGEGIAAGGMGGIPGLGDGRIEGEMMVINSRGIAEAVVDSLALHVHSGERVSSRASLFQVLAAPRDARPGSYDFVRAEDGSYSHTAEDGSTVRAGIGEPVTVGGIQIALSEALRSHPRERVRVEIEPYREVVDDLRDEIQIVRPDQSAPMVTVRYRSADSVLAAEVPNRITQRFVAYKMAMNQADGRRTMQFLEEQLATYTAQLQEAESALEGFREDAQVIAPDAQAQEQVRQLATLQARRDEAVAQRASLRQLFDRLRSADDAEQLRLYRQIAAYPAFFNSGVVQSTVVSLIDLENRRAEMLMLRRPENEDVQILDRRIKELERQINDFARTYLTQLDQQIESANAQLSARNAQVAAIPAREVEFVRRMRQQKALEHLSNLLQTRLKEAEIKSAGEPAKVHVIDSAIIPDEPLYPKAWLNLSLAGVLGLLLGTGVVAFREASHPAIRSREDIMQVTAGAPVLGQIPAYRNGGQGLLRNRLRLAAPPSNVPAALWLHPQSPTSDAYQALSANLTLVRGESSPQLLLVTSTGPGEANEISAANLAVAVAQHGVRTLLMDLDLASGSLHDLLQVQPAPGATELLRGDAHLDQVVQQLSLGEIGTEIDFVSAGTPTPRTAALLNSHALRDTLDELRGRYELVVIHAPPLGASVDAELLGQRTDATVLVARSGVTGKEALQLASERLTRLRIPLLGVVLNDAELATRTPARNRLAYT